MDGGEIVKISILILFMCIIILEAIHNLSIALYHPCNPAIIGHATNQVKTMKGVFNPTAQLTGPDYLYRSSQIEHLRVSWLQC